jgi:predicted HAD superfamily Cof-like phosphohydrolase
MSDFEKVCDFNKCFDFPQYDNMDNDNCRKLRLDLIDEELKELQEAYNNKDIVEEKDACADILYVAYGMAYTYKWNFDEVMSNYKLNNEETTLFNKLVPNYNIKDRHDILNKLNILFNNLIKSTNDKNLNLTIYNLKEFILHVYMFQYISNYNSDEIFDIVHKSNMSKLCKNEEEAKLTVLDYETKYKNGVTPYDSPYYYKLDNNLYVVKNKSTGKALKSINYIKVKL